MSTTSVLAGAVLTALGLGGLLGLTTWWGLGQRRRARRLTALLTAYRAADEAAFTELLANHRGDTR